MKKLLLPFIVFTMVQSLAQDRPIGIAEEKKGNRLVFYAINENYKEYDVLFEVKGTNFRQSKARPRWIRIPATSKVLVKTIVLLRDKTPQYTYSLQVNDSLSPRALKTEYTLIEVPPQKIVPKKQITIYTSENCSSCDTIISQLEADNYIFNQIRLSEKPGVKESLARMLNKSLDSLQDPIINLGGHLYTWIKDYDTLISELKK